jgi:phosphoenolpyruvate-protein kinase (PTS system EI component)
LDLRQLAFTASQPQPAAPLTMIGHIQESKAMLPRWQHLTGFVCPKGVATAASAIMAKANRRPNYATHEEVE